MTPPPGPAKNGLHPTIRSPRKPVARLGTDGVSYPHPPFHFLTTGIAMLTKPLLLSTALAAGLAAPAAAQTVTLRDLFNLDRLATFAGQWAVTTLRGVADVTYAHLDISPLSGRMVLTGLSVAPYERPECRFTVDRVVISTAPLDQIAFGALELDLMGYEMTQDCLPPVERQDLAELGITDLVLDRAELRAEYDFASGGMTVDFQAVSGALAELRGHADFDYFAVNFETEEPVVDFAYGEIDLTDRGAWRLFAAMIPPQMLDPDALTAMLAGELLDGSGAPVIAPPEDSAPAVPPTGGKEPLDDPAPAPEPAPLPAEPEVDLTDAGAAAYAVLETGATAFARFAADAGLLRLEFTPETPVRLTEEHFEDFTLFVTDLRPTLLTEEDRPDTRLTAEDAALIRGWIEGENDLGEPDLMRYANAFLGGIGAPRDPDLALELLTPLLDAGNPDAIAMALDTLDALDPDFAYEIALHAAAQGDRAAFAELDRLEAALDLSDLLAVQREAGDGATYTGTQTARDLRETAYAALTGLGAPRNYEQAYRFGLLALAAGDGAARSIVDELEAMDDRMSDEDAVQWARILDRARDSAQEAWFDID